MAAILVLGSACSGSSGTKPGVDVITTVAGAGVGPALAASGLATGRAGELFVSESDANRVVKVDDGGRLTAVAGRGTEGFSGDGGPAKTAEFSSPGALATDAAGNLFIADTGNNRVRKVDPSGRITTFAGNGLVGFEGDGGGATATALGGPTALTVDRGGRLFIGEGSTGRVRRVDVDGTIHIVAGGGGAAPAGHAGEAAGVDLAGLAGIAVNGAGDLLIAVPPANRVERVAPDGAVSVFAGAPYEANAAHSVLDELNGPTGIAVDGKGDVLVTELLGNRVRRIEASGLVLTLAVGGPQAKPDPSRPRRSDPVTDADFNGPDAIAVRQNGDVAVADSGNQRMRELSGRAARGYFVRPGFARRPLIDQIRPVQGGSTGATPVVIKGRGFVPERTSVRFGSQMSDIMSFHGDSAEATLLALAPARPPGATVDVFVTTPGGTSRASPATKYAYVENWELGAPLARARFTHTTTLLDPPACHDGQPPPGYPCGQVLVAGGNDGFCLKCVPFDSVELYDAARNSWRPVAHMNHARMNHTATLLPDGRVLVVAGKEGDTGLLAPTGPPDPQTGLPTGPPTGMPIGLVTAELYDPATDSWTDTASLAKGRFDHTATLLQDGRVLAAGGVDLEFTRNAVASAEVWDPVTGLWSTAGSMEFARENHTATALPDGRVLVAGGLGYPATTGRIDPYASALLGSTEIFDPGTNSWSRGPDMAAPRYAHTATTLANGAVLVVGGVGGGGFSRSAEIFDPDTSRWRAAGVPVNARASHAAALLPSGRVLVTGGGPAFENTTHREDSIASTEVYDPATDRWSASRVLNVGRTLATATVLDGPACRADTKPSYCGAVLVVGGGGTNDNPEPNASPIAQSSAELYR